MTRAIDGFKPPSMRRGCLTSKGSSRASRRFRLPDAGRSRRASVIAMFDGAVFQIQAQRDSLSKRDIRRFVNELSDAVDKLIDA